jgi:hypothetical protein
VALFAVFVIFSASFNPLSTMRLLICSLFSCFMLQAVAQQKHFELNLGWKSSTLELHSISDKNKQQSCTFIVGPDSIRALVFNNQVQVVQQFGMKHLYGQQLLGGFMRNGKVYLFTQEGTKDEWRNWVLDLASGTAEEHILPFDINKEKLVDRFSGGDRFIYITSNKKTAELIIYNFTSETQFDTLHYPLGACKADFGIVNMEGVCPIETAAEKNKLYLSGDTLLLVMNDQRDTTHVTGFDIPNKKISNWAIAHQAHAGTDNSFLFENKLFYVGASADSLCVQIADVYSGKIKKSYVALAEDTIIFKNTAIMQEGGFYSYGGTREIGKTKQLLRKMDNGDPVIGATINSNNQLELVVGSYMKMRVAMGTGGIAIRPTNTLAMMPAGMFYPNWWIKSARFKILLDARTLEHVGGIPGNSINEKIDYYTGGRKIPALGTNLFKTNGHYYVAYYENDSRKLSILKF